VVASATSGCGCGRGVAVLLGALVLAGAPVVEDDANLGVARCYTADPFGNRIELVDAADAGFTAP